MAVEFRCVHALDVRDTGLVTAAVEHLHRVLEDISALGQVVDEEVAGGIAGGFVVGQAVLIFVAGKHIDRLGAAAPLILQVDKFHVAVGSQNQAHNEFVSRLEIAVERLEHLTRFFVLTNVDLLGQAQRGGSVRGDFGHVLEVLPVHAAPCDAGVVLGHLHLAKRRGDFAAAKFLLIKSGAGLDVFRFNLFAVQRHLNEFGGGKQVVAAEKDRVDGIGGGLGGFPCLRLLLLDEPDLAFAHGLLVLGNFVKHLDHHGLSLDRCAVPPPRVLGVAPEHAEFLGGETMLEDRRDDVGRRFLVGEPMQRDADVRLGLAVAQRQPILFALTDKVVECSLVRGRDRLVFQVKTAAVKVERDGLGEVVFVQISLALESVVPLLNPVIEPDQCLDREADVHVLDSEMPQSCKAGGDVEGDVIVAAAAGHPWPATVRILRLGELVEQPLGIGVEPVFIEQDTDIPPGLTFIFRFAHPGRLEQEQALEVFVFLEWTVKCVGSLPQVKHASDARVGVGDVRSE